MRGHRVSGGRQVRHSDWVILEFGRLATVSERSLTYATVYRPPPDCTEAGGIPCRPVLEGLAGPFVLVGHSYSGVPVTEVAAAREDVTHVVYVRAFAMLAGTSMLDVLGGQPHEWWIFAEDGESIMPDYPGALLFSECAPAVANGAIARLRPHSARSVRDPLRGRIRGETRNVRDQRAGRDPSRKRGRRGSRTRAGHDHFPGLRPPPDARPPSRAGSHPGWDRRANRPRRTGRVLIRRFVLTGRAGVDARGQARYGAGWQGVGDSWSGTG